MNDLRRTIRSAALIGGLMLAPLVGCKNLPGGEKAPEPIIDDSASPATRARVDREKRGREVIVGGLIGAGDGYVLGASVKHSGKPEEQRNREADEAGRRARGDPATVADVTHASSADLNGDGFITMDEVVAMRNANLGDEETIDRLLRADRLFQVTGQQQTYLLDRGVSPRVIDAMREIDGDDRRPPSAADGRYDSREGLN